MVELGMLFAGPLVATNLGDLGAEVIKIEHPHGDEVRGAGSLKDGESLWWRVTARNKHLLAVDVSKPEGARIVKRLAKTADVFIENFRPGRVAQWGLDYKSLSAENPGLVMLHVSGYGQTGPYSNRAGLGTLAEAFSGYAFATGEVDGPPSLPAFPLADGVAALTGTYAVLAALFERERNGGFGDEVEVSLYEPLLSLTGSTVINFDQLGIVAKRKGNRSTWAIPRNTYKARDGKWLVVTGAANSAALRIFRAIGRDDMANDPELATNQGRLRHKDEIDRIVADWVAERDLDEVLTRFAEADVLAGPVNDIEQILADPHVRQRGTLTKLDDPALGEVTIQNVVPRFTHNPGRVRWLGKRNIGQDTEAVLRQAGFHSDEISGLADAGTIRLTSVSP